jgi:hypothetical protein
MSDEASFDWGQLLPELHGDPQVLDEAYREARVMVTSGMPAAQVSARLTAKGLDAKAVDFLVQSALHEKANRHSKLPRVIAVGPEDIVQAFEAQSQPDSFADRMHRRYQQRASTPNSDAPPDPQFEPTVSYAQVLAREAQRGAGGWMTGFIFLLALSPIIFIVILIIVSCVLDR